MDCSLALPPCSDTSRVRVEALREKDVSRYCEIYRDPRVAVPFGLPEWDEADARAAFDSALAFPQEQGRVFALRPADGGELLGVLRVGEWDRRSHHVTLAYLLCPTVWGQGLMRECLSHVLPWLFAGGLGEAIYRVQAWVLASNRRSRGLLKRLGFEHEGTLRGLFHQTASHRDVCNYGLLVTDRLSITI